MYTHGDPHIVLVLYWHAFLGDRGKDIFVYSFDQLHFCRDGEEDFPSQRVSSLIFFHLSQNRLSRGFFSVLTRPYVSGQFRKGSQCPLLVKKVGT